MLPIELLEKYHTGELKPEEMQQIEKAMLQNPFLAETVEGIALSDKTSGKNFLEQVESIKREMSYHQNDKKHSLIIEKNKAKNNIYSLAAVILLLLTTGIALWFYSQNNLEKSAKLNDASATMAYQPRDEESAENNKDFSMPKATTTDLRKEITTEKLNDNTPKEVNKRDKNDMPSTDSKKEVIVSQEKNINDKLITTNIPEKTANMASAAPIIASKPQTEEAKKESETRNTAKGNEGQELDIALADDMEIIEDKSKSKRSNVILKEESRKKDMITSIEPEMGLQNYEIYLSKNLNKSIANGKKGKVIIEILINENGTIKGTKILQSLCDACDIEVQRLIIEGGKWKINGKIAQKELKKVIEIVF